jgi:uncharacterized protein (TIGR00730 family)
MPLESQNESSPILATNGPVSLGDEQAVREIVASSVLRIWEVVNNLTRLRPTKREHYWVTIFGSARVQPEMPLYGEVRELARLLASDGCGIVTGGGPGLMQAANEGAALAGKGASLGVRVDLPFEQEVNPFVTRAFEHRTFFTRLHQFVLMSEAFIVVPGGIGTALELLMVWQLLQVRHLDNVPLILVGPMWPPLIEWARTTMVDGPTRLASPEDMRIPVCVATMEEAAAIVREHHERYRQATGG